MSKSATDITMSSPAASAAFAKSLLGIAADLERDEARIKRAVLDAAEAGDAPRAADIVRRWLEQPPAEVVAYLGLA